MNDTNPINNSTSAATTIQVQNTTQAENSTAENENQLNITTVMPQTESTEANSSSSPPVYTEGTSKILDALTTQSASTVEYVTSAAKSTTSTSEYITEEEQYTEINEITSTTTTTTSSEAPTSSESMYHAMYI